MKRLDFRPLRADEIECRVNTISEKGCTLLLYKNARCDMNILDETVGSMNWERDHKELKGNMYAGIGIWDEEKTAWVWKWDCGTQSYTEAEKGEASDSFKRAGFNWGIGRELYTAPFIFIPAESVRLVKTERTDKYGKPVYTTFDTFFVERIQTIDGRITGLSIKNGKTGKRVFLLMPPGAAA